MGFIKGQSGNPGGRPPKSRALTELLEKAGSKTVEVDGRRVSGKRLYAENLWSLINTGQIKLNDKTLKISSAKEWTDIVLKMLSHIDGPPKQSIDVTTGGETINDANSERFDRALSTFADAIGEIIHRAGTDGQGDMDTPE